MDLEEFIDIQGYEGFYKINRNGDIFSVLKNKILKTELNKDGYYRIGLSKDNKQKHFLIHRLIALNFIPNPENLTIIDHIDRNKTNNNIENLRWVTQSDNCKNREIKGCITVLIRKNKTTDNIYYQVRVRNKHLKIFKEKEDAEEFLNKYLNENEN